MNFTYMKKSLVVDFCTFFILHKTDSLFWKVQTKPQPFWYIYNIIPEKKNLLNIFHKKH